MPPPNLLPLDQEFERLLRDEVGLPVAFLRAPQTDSGETAALPYMVIYPVPGGRGFYGPVFADPEGDADVHYQIKSIGRRYDQARALSDRVRQVVVGRGPDSRFTYGINPTGLTVADRYSEGSTGPPRRDGNLFYVDDEYCVRVTTS